MHRGSCSPDALPSARELLLRSLQAVTISRMAKYVPQGSWPSLSHLIKDLEDSAERGFLSLPFHPTETVSTKATQRCSSTLSKTLLWANGPGVRGMCCSTYPPETLSHPPRCASSHFDTYTTAEIVHEKCSKSALEGQITESRAAT